MILILICQMNLNHRLRRRKMISHYVKSVPSGKTISHNGSRRSIKDESIWCIIGSSNSHFLSTGMNSSMRNPQPKIGNFIKLLLSTYLMCPKHPFRSARSHGYIQSTSVLWFAISNTRSPSGAVPPEKITFVLFIFSKKNGHRPSQRPKR